MILHQDKSLDKIKGDIKYKLEETMCLILVTQGMIFDIEDILEEIHVIEDKIKARSDIENPYDSSDIPETITKVKSDLKNANKLIIDYFNAASSFILKIDQKRHLLENTEFTQDIENINILINEIENNLYKNIFNNKAALTDLKTQMQERLRNIKLKLGNIIQVVMGVVCILICISGIVAVSMIEYI
ncbi:hypothetical protein NEPAR04_1194 [Nematocida parisii]|nr:hypothetical protein NEPAR03_0123 [Nematocida parisii]KAI5125572.1 hypothetical protein NEPAR08_0123 [Nematocida parisii]KAI5141807.1 hypothetical protein NEPAR04_1194 [Nematocida parisii]